MKWYKIKDSMLSVYPNGFYGFYAGDIGFTVQEDQYGVNLVVPGRKSTSGLKPAVAISRHALDFLGEGEEYCPDDFKLSIEETLDII
jgi:hypothetical protein